MSIFEFIGALTTAVAVFGYVNHRFIRLPDTIGITAMGLLVSLVLAVVGRYVPGAVEWATSFSERLDFPDVVFHGLLSILLFAGSLHINIGELHKQRLPVFVLATGGVLISTVLVGLATYAILAAFSTPVPLSYCFLFGALISPTDPIAVLSVLKTAGVPKSLEMTFSGESLFNDGTAVVAYLILAGIVTGASEPTFANVGLLLAEEVLGALVVGLVVGYFAFFLLKGVDSYAVEILITLALATGGYSLAERLHVSAPLAVVVMGLVIGNHGARSAMSEKTREHLFPFWELLDEVLNLMLFGLIGIKLLALASDDISWWEAAALVPIVLLARFISVGVVKLLLRPWLNTHPHVVKVMTWGGLRGGISVALALSLPDFDGRLLFVQATFAVVLVSLLIQAPTLSWVLKRYDIADGHGDRPSTPSP